MDAMDPEQVLIAEAERDRHVKVLAAPGSGKTKVLIARVRHLMESQGVKPKRIRVVTFSRQATQDIQARLDGRIKASTIHSFCLELAEVFEPVVRNGLRHVSGPCALAVEVEAASGGLFPAETLVSGAEAEVFVPDEHIFRLLRAFRAGAVDGDTAEQVRASVPDYLMIDEFQDTNAVQFEVVRLLVQRYGTRVFAVGDKNQTIYGFRNSDPALFDEVDGLGTYACATFSLKRNYRSTPAIVDFCNDVCPEGGAGRMVAARESGPSVALPRLAVFEDRSDESAHVAAAVMELRRAGEDDVAVMARTQKDAYAMAHKLSELKVPASIFMGDSDGSRPKKRRVSKREGLAPVFVCTIHAAKGLEWKHVFLVGCSDALNRCLTAKELEQELNLFYVACSRAKDGLTLTSPTKCITRLLFRVHESRYEIDRASDRTVAPMFGYFGDAETQMTTHRSVTHFVRYATGEFFDSAKLDGLVPRGFPGATIERLHAVHAFPYGSDLNVMASTRRPDVESFRTMHEYMLMDMYEIFVDEFFKGLKNHDRGFAEFVRLLHGLLYPRHSPSRHRIPKSADDARSPEYVTLRRGFIRLTFQDPEAEQTRVLESPGHPRQIPGPIGQAQLHAS
ncbi:DNA helicase II / ATP-dependent DNA helicase PcrA [Klebsormidium nitens]|uniref:DNA 3'-5' helicase n=1 Tax=Klebsormidium nitens TaxID=105231 RepID=A0A1Y1I8S6_KLENI|nr:DNA helicase II / ATP-dependent DNA helicase PcrA [Klebsormidium nitens]|eukprot:GAQ85107.1 DNA helicase II / ATP-dependent DNA helicase PcrA [Klebsormidium nitens]